MLQDELRQLSGVCSAEALSAVKASWRAAVFSDASDHSLKRYFNYHLAGISELLGQKATDQDGLLELVDHLLIYHQEMLDPMTFAPAAYRDRELAILRPQLKELTLALAGMPVGQELKDLLTGLFRQWEQEAVNGQMTFGGLRYFRIMVKRLCDLLAGPAAGEAELHVLLEELNFNHLGYFCYRRQELLAQGGKLSAQQRLNYYTDKLRSWQIRPVTERQVYHPDWPSLTTMLSDMLAEEVRALQVNDVKQARPLKIRLDLSVAHAACLLHLLADEGVFGDQPLQAIFRSFSENFSTKRQDSVSAHSLSKAYYSIDQVTAAVMRDKLHKMITRIDRDFFPE